MNDDELINVLKRNKIKRNNILEEKPILPKTKHHYLQRLISRILLSIILLLIGLIINNSNQSLTLKMKKMFFEDSFSFGQINNLYQKYFGGVIPFDNLNVLDVKPVFNETLEYSDANVYENGVSLIVSNHYLVPVLESGIVVFIGEKDKLNNTVIIQGVNGVDYWYSNIDNLSIKLYDYIEKGDLLGETKSNILYMNFQKDGTYLDYNEYIK